MSIRYGRRHPLRTLISRLRHTTCPPRMIFESLFNHVPSNPVGCMVCVYDEQETIVNALKTTMDVVDFYVVVDKNGDTVATIEESDLEIDVECHVKTDLTLAESREYALERLKKAEWVLIQDGDEFYTDRLSGLPRDRPHRYYRTHKNLIYPNRTMPLHHSGYHNFLFHNNGTIHIPYPNDVPRMKGRGTHLPEPLIWNYHNKRRPKPQTVHYNRVYGSLPPQLEIMI